MASEQPVAKRSPLIRLLGGLKWALLRVVYALDYLLMALFAGRRPTVLDDANARYGLDRRDGVGDIVGRHGAEPGQRPPRT